VGGVRWRTCALVCSFHSGAAILQLTLICSIERDIIRKDRLSRDVIAVFVNNRVSFCCSLSRSKSYAVNLGTKKCS
jgi:hypothetical protein